RLMAVLLLATCVLVVCTTLCVFFFFQAEDGIRDWSVTGVQTCALPILAARTAVLGAIVVIDADVRRMARASEACRRLMSIPGVEIGRASCREKWRSRWSA